MDDVAIVGVGLHPFGRFPGMSGIDMGAVAIRRALADAGVEWRDIQFGFAGSYEVDNPDAVVALLGLTGIQFTNVYNGCATAASVLTLAANTIRLGEHDLGIAVGMDKHLPGAFSADPRDYACPSWFGQARPSKAMRGSTRPGGPGTGRLLPCVMPCSAESGQLSGSRPMHRPTR